MHDDGEAVPTAKTIREREECCQRRHGLRPEGLPRSQTQDHETQQPRGLTAKSGKSRSLPVMHCHVPIECAALAPAHHNDCAMPTIPLTSALSASLADP
jgi:hypothetical protein